MSTEARAPVTIDAMNEADLAVALRIDLSAFGPSGAHAGLAGRDEADVERAREQQLREELARPWARLRVARGEAGTPIGYTLFWHVVDELHLLNVAVAPEFRRRGIGRALMDDLLEYASRYAVARVLLEVRASNVAAIALYESLGFETFNVRARYYSDGEDALEMVLTIAR